MSTWVLEILRSTVSCSSFNCEVCVISLTPKTLTLGPLVV